MTYATKPKDTCMVVVFPRGQLSRDDKARLTRSGIIAVEADDPSAVSILNLLPGTSATVSADDLFMSALHAAAAGNEGQKMVLELNRRMRAREEAAAQERSR